MLMLFIHIREWQEKTNQSELEDHQLIPNSR
uniref:Uncharacterized protein n=1 Tax=Rhizophora mucronata TaxID=61149 RepID=A0A2P2IV48_RHIMU